MSYFVPTIYYETSILHSEHLAIHNALEQVLPRHFTLHLQTDDQNYNDQNKSYPGTGTTPINLHPLPASNLCGDETHICFEAQHKIHAI